MAGGKRRHLRAVRLAWTLTSVMMRDAR